MLGAFYDDSIVTGWHGIGAPGCRWASLGCSQLGWREMTFAGDGVGFVRRRGSNCARHVEWHALAHPDGRGFCVLKA